MLGCRKWVVCKMSGVEMSEIRTNCSHFQVLTWEHCVFMDTKQLPLLLPLPTILLKLPLLLPGVSSRLNRIRQGVVF